ncbi:DUF1045 domain-containing protein [Variovorax paradoxus]|uniref:Phosphonate metabolism protein n=1 Tax=Variovorax paradoxus TaxID=34073 RepID=A0A0H2MGU1_VARPD|nr:DUF1045 domain-containing protein [Variovorax paradoxus]KLN56040.1 hypothetical protein VPARA_27210 [Variovorax paradoxus]
MTEAVSRRCVAAHRYAAYFAPATGSPWWEAGSHWLGRCAARGQLLPQPAIEGMPPARQQALTAAPRRYGWHATLKAPFALPSHLDARSLRSGIRHICNAWEPFDMPALAVVRLDDFLALVPAAPSRALNALASACVTGLHAFAAPLPAAELQRRRAAGLTPEEDALLQRWGYPFVLDRFRFHFSLSGSLRGIDETDVQALHAAAQRHFGALPAQRFDAISLFAEPEPRADFMCIEQMALGA